MTTAGLVPSRYREPAMAKRIALIAESFARLLSRPLVAVDGDMVAALWHAPFAVVAHGKEADPAFFFGNACALAAFESDIEHFLGMPSRLSAEAPLREERQLLLDRVTAKGFIDDYEGIRISAKGRRFHIGPTVVWNLVDAEGRSHGQAAMFQP